jgi:acetylornithine/succinyldiaminopimelate/putrescine aminotransferase
VVCQAALKTLEIIERDDLLKHVVKIGEYFDNKLSSIIENKLAKNYRGLGLMKALTLNGDYAAEISRDCLKNGLLVNNVKADTLRFLPPLIIGKKEVDLAIKILEKSLKAVE